MKFGLAFASSVGNDPDSALEICRCAERAGFDSVWGGEHVIRPTRIASPYPYTEDGEMPGEPDTPIPDPLIWLAYVAAVTDTLRLGTGILILPQRNPLVTAKAVASLDLLSGGRVSLGIGVGWLEEEFDSLGVPFEGRGARTDEYVAAMRALWTEDKASVDGEFVSFANAISKPKPPQGSVPVVVGGHTKASARRAGRLGDGFFPGKGSDDEIAALLDEMATAAKEAGRDPDAIEVTIGGAALFGDDTAEAVEHYEKMGVDRMVIPPLAFSVEEIGPVLDGFAERVISGTP